jgi:hypothetical protein
MVESYCTYLDNFGGVELLPDVEILAVMTSFVNLLKLWR